MNMLKLTMKLIVLLFAMSLGLSACNNDGAFEEAGESIDEVVEDTSNELEDACEKVKESAGAKDEDC